MRWAIIDNHTVTNVAVADEAYAVQQGWIPCPDYAGPGWGYVDGTFTEPTPTLEAVAPTPTLEAVAPTPTKEDLLAQLAALQQQIQALV